MPVWLYWVLGGVATYFFSVHQQRQSALQSIDVALLQIKAQTAASAANATNTIQVQSQAGPLTADSTVPQATQQQAQLLSTNTLAPDWLVLASAVQSAGYTVLANSIATLAMTLLESGQLNIT